MESSGVANKASRIVVIDDPVSSLSRNHVYDIANLVTNTLIDSQSFPKIVICTHSLFFFHELLRCTTESRAKRYQCFRVTKRDFSNVTPLGHKEISNDYQAYWHVLREAIEDGKYSVSIPIAIRNILEHYFGFVRCRSKLRAVLSGFGSSDKEFQGFYRYINRQSHSDEVNISDLPPVEPTIYLDKFRMIFESAEHIAHFRAMMGSDSNDEDSDGDTAPSATEAESSSAQAR